MESLPDVLAAATDERAAHSIDDFCAAHDISRSRLFAMLRALGDLPDVLAAVNVEPVAYSIDDFCAAHAISRGRLYALWRAGRGPRRMIMGRTVRITADAAAEWRRERETFPLGAYTKWTPEARDRVRGKAAA